MSDSILEGILDDELLPKGILREGPFIYTLMFSRWRRDTEEFKNRMWGNVYFHPGVPSEEKEEVMRTLEAAQALRTTLQNIISDIPDHGDWLAEKTRNKARYVIEYVSGISPSLDEGEPKDIDEDTLHKAWRRQENTLYTLMFEFHRFRSGYSNRAWTHINFDNEVSVEEREETLRILQASYEAKEILSDLIASLPSQRDWLDPVLEESARHTLDYINQAYEVSHVASAEPRSTRI